MSKVSRTIELPLSHPQQTLCLCKTHLHSGTDRAIQESVQATFQLVPFLSYFPTQMTSQCTLKGFTETHQMTFSSGMPSLYCRSNGAHADILNSDGGRCTELALTYLYRQDKCVARQTPKFLSAASQPRLGMNTSTRGKCCWHNDVDGRPGLT